MIPLARSLGPMGMSGKAGGLHVLDHFTDMDGTHLHDHVPDLNTPSGAWSDIKGALAITGNKLVPSANATAYECLIESGKADVTVSGVFVTTWNSSYSESGLILRAADGMNHWLGISQQGPGYYVLRIYEYTNNVYTIRSSSETFIPALGEPYVITFAAAGNILTLSSGAISCTYTSAVRNTATQCGVECYAAQATIGRYTSIDDFEILPL